MDARAIKRLLDDLQRHEHGWQGPVPRAYGTFFGKQICLVVETLAVADDDASPPPLSPAEKKLARAILAELPQVLQNAEEKLRDHCAERNPEAIERIENPHIWLCRDTLEEDGPGRWEFVVGQEETPDFGYHIEFDELECQNIWAAG
jgi:hypothetical protein